MATKTLKKLVLWRWSVWLSAHWFPQKHHYLVFSSYLFWAFGGFLIWQNLEWATFRLIAILIRWIISDNKPPLYPSLCFRLTFTWLTVSHTHTNKLVSHRQKDTGFIQTKRNWFHILFFHTGRNDILTYCTGNNKMYFLHVSVLILCSTNLLKQSAISELRWVGWAVQQLFWFFKTLFWSVFVLIQSNPSNRNDTLKRYLMKSTWKTCKYWRVGGWKLSWAESQNIIYAILPCLAVPSAGTLWLRRRVKETGQWAPLILGMGVVVKQTPEPCWRRNLSLSVLWAIKNNSNQYLQHFMSKHPQSTV